MHSPVRQQLLDASVSLIQTCRPLVEAVAHRDRDLATQLRRALNSVALNVGEGFGTGAGNARLRFSTARGSLFEVRAALLVAVAWHSLSAEQIAPALTAIDSLGARVFGLSRK